MLEGCIYSILLRCGSRYQHTQTRVYLCVCRVYISTGALPKPTRHESHCGFSLSALFKHRPSFSFYLSIFYSLFLKGAGLETTQDTAAPRFSRSGAARRANSEAAQEESLTLPLQAETHTHKHTRLS